MMIVLLMIKNRDLVGVDCATEGIATLCWQPCLHCYINMHQTPGII